LEHGGNRLATLETYSRAAGRMVDYNSEKGRYRALGTGGSIYRTESILKVGGFDENLRGYGEDWDAEIRIRVAGWRLGTVDVKFSDYERHKITWKNLWRRYWLRGYYSHYFAHKNRGFIKHYRMFPPAAFLAGTLLSRKLFRLTNEKIVFFLPLQQVFKATAWYFGFTHSHLKRNQPGQKLVA
jgi:GT2 family glycosyltransferase